MCQETASRGKNVHAVNGCKIGRSRLTPRTLASVKVNECRRLRLKPSSVASVKVNLSNLPSVKE